MVQLARNGNMGDDSSDPEIICRPRDYFFDGDFLGVVPEYHSNLKGFA